jgi:hypothetical protein
MWGVNADHFSGEVRQTSLTASANRHGAHFLPEVRGFLHAAGAIV